MYDFVIIGAGMAGASLAYRLGERARVLVLEAESMPGYHSSGRSAAMFMETYGTASVRALTRASRSFLTAPPIGFCDHPLLTDRGVLYIVRESQIAQREETVRQFERTGVAFGQISAQEVLERVPVVRQDGLVGALEEANAKDIDVHMLLQGFLKGARRAGVEFKFDARVETAVPRMIEGWRLALSNGETVEAGVVVNAAGAWAQALAAQFGAQPVGLQPKRRSAFTFKPCREGESEPLPAETFNHWPAVVGIDESFYFKPDAGQLLGSPANADPVSPHDVVPEELDIAIGIDRITRATTLQVRRPSHTWAGLRSFVPDGDFVIGWDAQVPGLFWLAGQGGYGIQTSPAASLLASNLLLAESVDLQLQNEGIDGTELSPRRLQAAH